MCRLLIENDDFWSTYLQGSWGHVTCRNSIVPISIQFLRLLGHGTCQTIKKNIFIFSYYFEDTLSFRIQILFNRNVIIQSFL